MDGDRLRDQSGEKEEKHPNADKARLPSSGRGNRTGANIGKLKHLNIREAIEVMKILAPIAQDITNADNAAGMMRIIFEHFEKTEPTQTLQLASLFFHEPIETLAEVLKDRSSEEFFYMMVEAFAENSLADLIETIFALGFTQKKVSDAG